MSNDTDDIMIANEDQTIKIIKLIQSAKESNNLKIGANEATKSLNKGKAHMIILANDCEPREIIAHLPLICQDKNVPYMHVASKEVLGKACELTRNVIALAIVSDTEMSAERIEKAVKSIIYGNASK